MKAYRANRLGGPQALALAEAGEPVPGPEDVAIAVEAVGLNLADLAALAGERQPRPGLPFTPGVEIAGRVVGGEGRRVVAFVPWGGLAERVVARREACVAVPDNLDASQAAALPLAYAGALMALEGKARLTAGQDLLVLGAGGAAGLAAIAIGKLLGARVIGAANGAERLAQARAHGADQVFDSGLVAVAEAAREATGGKGADVVFDPVGGDASTAALAALAQGGRIVAAGFAGGRASALNPARLFLLGGELLTANTILEVERYPLAARDALARVVAWTEEGRLSPRIAAQFAFADVRHALDYVGSRKGSGAVVVKIET
ncbi:MAG TPA: zinc-binding dehydrogenase [Rhizomicrobium sp.]|nr:zinc-binding dehydrogenase [Rhizomicrobium sp.]